MNFENNDRKIVFKNNIYNIFVDRFPINIKNHHIYYVEKDYDERINNFFHNHYDKVKQIFNSRTIDGKNLEFIYIPKLKEKTDFIEIINKIITYKLPAAQLNEQFLNKFQQQLSTKLFTSEIFYNILHFFEYDIMPGFFRKVSYHGSQKFRFSYVLLQGETDEQLLYFLKNYVSALKNESPDVFYQMSRENDDSFEVNFDLQMQMVGEKIKEEINYLLSEGHQELLMAILKNAQIPLNSNKKINHSHLSKLQINKEYKIILPDFDNMEIEMTPLPKAVYFLFLQHPEGILLKYLADYKEELLYIYKHLSYRESPEEMEKSINELVDPTKNSINEKCSRIKEAFLKKMDDNIAKHYYINGNRGMPKNIKLSQEFILWENVFGSNNIKFINLKDINDKEDKIKQLKKELPGMIGKKEYSAGIHTASEIISLQQSNFDAFFYRAICYFNIGEYQKSIDDATKAIAINNEIDNTFYNRAEAYYMLKEFDKALTDIQQYISKDSFGNYNANTYYLRGLIYEGLNDIDKACSDWQNAAKYGHTDAEKKIQIHKKSN